MRTRRRGPLPPGRRSSARTARRVYRLAYRLTGNQHDAEDLTQEVFVRVFRSLSTYTPGTFEGWLHRITTNLFLDTVRRKQRIRFDALGDDAAERLPSREPTPQQHFNDTHFDADVQQALDTLAPEFRAAVVLCDIEGLSYEEIAATLGVKLGTVRSRIHRGRSHLRKALAAPLARSQRRAAARAERGACPRPGPGRWAGVSDGAPPSTISETAWQRSSTGSSATTRASVSSRTWRPAQLQGRGRRPAPAEERLRRHRAAPALRRAAGPPPGSARRR